MAYIETIKATTILTIADLQQNNFRVSATNFKLILKDIKVICSKILIKKKFFNPSIELDMIQLFVNNVINLQSILEPS